jgi:hypothetical protein
MLYAFIVSAVLLLAGILLLGLRIFFTKTGKFPNIHIGGSKALRDKGIGCATSQDRQAQQKIKRIKVSDMINEITENY